MPPNPRYEAGTWTPRDDLRGTIAYALQQVCRDVYALLRQRDPREHDKAYDAMAEAVIVHLELCGYRITHPSHPAAYRRRSPASARAGQS